MAFTLEERQALGIHGFLPPRVKTQQEQVEHCRLCLERLDDDLNKYIFLMGLLVRTEIFLQQKKNVKPVNLGSEWETVLSSHERKHRENVAFGLYTDSWFGVSEIWFGFQASQRTVYNHLW